MGDDNSRPGGGVCKNRTDESIPGVPMMSQGCAWQEMREGRGGVGQGVSKGSACGSLQITPRNTAFILKDGSLLEDCTEVCDLIYFLK